MKHVHLKPWNTLTFSVQIITTRKVVEILKTQKPESKG